MTTVLIGSILIPGGDSAPYQTPRRVLAAEGTGYWLIPVEFEGKRKHARGPKFQDAERLEGWLDEGRLRIGEFQCPNIWLASDDKLNQWFGGSDENPCKIIKVRNRAYEAIAPYIADTAPATALSTGSYTAWIRKTAQAGPHKEAFLYDALHRFWAGGMKNALLGWTHHNGGRGTKKKQATKLGRPNAIDKAADRASSGYPLSEDDKLKLQCGWQCFVSDGRSTKTAYLETMGQFYLHHKEAVDDRETVVLLEANLRPTLKQFRYWGPADDPGQSATRRMLGEHEYRLNHRGMPGSSADGVLVIGQRGWSDSSGGDVRLRSVALRSIEVGIPTVLPVMDARSEVICGIYIGFERPSARVQLLAAAHAALPKSDWCARFGIYGVTEDQWPRVRFDQMFLDNGEGRNAQTMRVYLKAWEGWIEYAPAGNGRAKGPIEGEHHVRHVEVDQFLPGATHPPYGASRQANLSVLNYYEYVAHHIRRILYHNTQQSVPHLVTGEMREELNVTATRMDVFRWLVRHGYVNSQPPDPDIIRAHMLPSFAATITGNGIYLHRPDRGAKKEFVEQCRFVGPYLMDSGLLDAARKQVIPAEVSLDPNDLSVAWFRTRDHGLQRLENICPDRWLIQHCTLDELLLIQDRDHLTLLRDASRAEQAAFNRIAERESAVAATLANAQAQTECTPPLCDQPAPANSSEARRQETGQLEQAGLADPTGKRTSTRPELTPAAHDVQTTGVQDPTPDNQSYQHDEPFDDVMTAIENFQTPEDHDE
jgi:hypothetical protein